ncbi:MAG: hypothetical protein ACTINM_06975 [Acetobacter cibinongensis]
MRRLVYSSLVLGAVASLSSYAKAEKTLVSVGGLTVQGGLDIGGAAFYRLCCANTDQGFPV